MAHNLMSNYFMDARGKTPWHRIGHYTEQLTIGAVDAYDRFTPAIYSLEPIGVSLHGENVPVDSMAIVRWPMPAKGYEKAEVMAVVGNKFTLVEPRDACEIFDVRVGKQVETIGMLNDGTLFLTVAMRKYDIQKDEINQYMIVTVPCNGKDSIKVAVSAVRVVCSNTLAIALNGAELKHSVSHTSQAKRLLDGWMGDVWSKSDIAGQEAEEAFNRMALKPANASIAEDLFSRIFSYPAPPAWAPVEEIRRKRQYGYETAVDRADAHRKMAMNVWNGASYESSVLGYESPAHNTVWGLYNAATETLQYAGQQTKNRDQSVINGDHSLLLKRAFAICNDI